WAGNGVLSGYLDTIQVSSSGPPMECVGVSRHEGDTVDLVPAWQRGAEFDIQAGGSTGTNPSNYAIRALPGVSGTWWDLVKETASDTMSYVWFDEDGRFHMRRSDW